MTSTGAWQAGQSRDLTSVVGARSSHGPTGRAVSSTLTVMLSWQGASQVCPHCSALLQGNLQPGQAPGWQGWAARAGWWQSEAAWQGLLHLGVQVQVGGAGVAGACLRCCRQGCHQRFWIYPLFEQKMFQNVQFYIILYKIFHFYPFFGCF